MCIFKRKKEKAETIMQKAEAANQDAKHTDIPEENQAVNHADIPEEKQDVKPAQDSGVKHILLIGDCIDSRETLFDFFREKLDADKLIGSNLDALYDVLSTVHEETVIEIINEYHLEKVLGRTYGGLISVLLDAAEENPALTVQRNIE